MEYLMVGAILMGPGVLGLSLVWLIYPDPQRKIREAAIARQQARKNPA
jgi:hypothetical protein